MASRVLSARVMFRRNGGVNGKSGKPVTNRPAAYVLSRVVTGLATVRSLAAGYMPITAISYVPREPVQYSRHCSILRAPGAFNSEEDHVEWIAEHCARQTERPVLLPTSDADALLLAKHRERIRPVALTWTTSHDDLNAIIDKSKLYAHAAAAGIPAPPCLKEPDMGQLRPWCVRHDAPYLVKPFYTGVTPCAFQGKNRRFESSPELMDFARRNGMKSCIVQPMIAGGDGYIFDTYGLSDSNHRIVSYATHRRWRQFPPHVGITSYGEIPARENVDVLFDYTQRLVKQTRYHGIFGIEWLKDKQSGQWYLLDFNARPFSSIGHLTDSGLNLPLLAYYELTGQLPRNVPQRPALRHCYWIDLLEDFKTVVERPDIAISRWLRSVLRARSFAYWSLRDPGPAMCRLWEVVPLSGRVFRRAAARHFGLFSLLMGPVAM